MNQLSKEQIDMARVGTAFLPQRGSAHAMLQALDRLEYLERAVETFEASDAIVLTQAVRLQDRVVELEAEVEALEGEIDALETEASEVKVAILKLPAGATALIKDATGREQYLAARP